MRNLAMKVCRNVAINGKAMPCVLNKASQINVAAQAGECLQQVMVKTKAMQEAVSMVETSSSLILDNPTTVSTAKAINVGILVALLTVAIAVAIAVARKPRKAFSRSAQAWQPLGRVLGPVHRSGQPEGSPKQELPDLRGHQGPGRWKNDGTLRDHCGGERRLRPRRGVPWVGLRVQVHASSVRGSVLLRRIVPGDGDCDACCPSGCVSMVDRVRPATPSANVACRGKGEGACTKPCLWTGEQCIDAPSAWGAQPESTEERLWCMACTDKKGNGTLYHTMPSTLETVDDVLPSQLACLTSIPFTGAIKTPPPLPAGKGDAPRLRTVGIVGLSTGVLCLVVGAWLAAQRK